MDGMLFLLKEGEATPKTFVRALIARGWREDEARTVLWSLIDAGAATLTADRRIVPTLTATS